MNIIGISAFYHDSAACLVQDGEIVAAAQEERFSRKKNDESFPHQALDYCLREGGITPEQVDYVAFYDKPLLKFDRLLETYLSYAPRGLKMFMRAMPIWLRQKLHIPRELHRGLKGAYKKQFVFLEHHESHAASAFFPSPFEEAAIVTLDGVGEWATGTIGIGRGNKIELLKEMRFPHSLGLLYSALTYFTGFAVNSGEYKLMGLAPYGTPVYAERIFSELMDLKGDGSFRLDMSFFAYCHQDVMTSSRMEELFEGPPRKAGTEITQREMDIAASIQLVTEEVTRRVARHAHELTGCENLVMAGGVALNCVSNGRLLREGPFRRIWVQPASGDSGGALGAATFVWHQLLDGPRDPRPLAGMQDRQRGSLLGPNYSKPEIERTLDEALASYSWFECEAELCRVVADLIAAGRVVGHMAGRMEFGPRALGSRSILGDPRSAEMQSIINAKIKFRESFRPFAPAVLTERAHEYFELEPGQTSPFMLFVVPVTKHKRIPPSQPGTRGLGQLGQVRSVIPAVTHVDYSARVQTVDEQTHPRFRRIIEAFQERTGFPLVINTSFNVRDEPIVESPSDAYRCFMNTDMDALVIENFLLLKEGQPNTLALCGRANASTKKRWKCMNALLPTPDDSTLCQFGWIALPFFAALALFAWFEGGIFSFGLGDGRSSVALLLLVTGVATGVFSLLAPRLNRYLYIPMVVLTSPMGWVLARATFILLFLVLFVPIALIFRLLGRDPMERKFEPSTESYWSVRPPKSRETYLRQF